LLKNGGPEPLANGGRPEPPVTNGGGPLKGEPPSEDVDEDRVDVKKVEEGMLDGNIDVDVTRTVGTTNVVGTASLVGAGAGATVPGSTNVVPGSTAAVGKGSITVVSAGSRVEGSSGTVVTPGSTAVVSDIFAARKRALD
jgi:hypothetical protein